MNKFLDRFGIFDIFGMLIPGILFVMGILYFFPEIVPTQGVLIEGGAKYFTFFVLSYFVGVLFHEISGSFEHYIVGRIFKQKHEQIFLSSEKKSHGKIDFYIFKKIRDDVYKECISKDLESQLEDITEKDKNRFALHYCLTTLESENLISKAEKMQSISEMSRSICWICGVLLIFYVMKLYNYMGTVKVWIIPLVLGISMIFFGLRKRRFERFRSDIIMRNYYIYKKKSNNASRKKQNRRPFDDKRNGERDKKH